MDILWLTILIIIVFLVGYLNGLYMGSKKFLETNAVLHVLIMLASAIVIAIVILSIGEAFGIEFVI